MYECIFIFHSLYRKTTYRWGKSLPWDIKTICNSWPHGISHQLTCLSRGRLLACWPDCAAAVSPEAARQPEGTAAVSTEEGQQSLGHCEPESHRGSFCLLCSSLSRALNGLRKIAHSVSASRSLQIAPQRSSRSGLGHIPQKNELTSSKNASYPHSKGPRNGLDIS